MLSCSHIPLNCLQTFLINEYTWAQRWIWWITLAHCFFSINHCSWNAMTADWSTRSLNWQHRRCTSDGSDFFFTSLNIHHIDDVSHKSNTFQWDLHQCNVKILYSLSPYWKICTYFISSLWVIMLNWNKPKLKCSKKYIDYSQ